MSQMLDDPKTPATARCRVLELYLPLLGKKPKVTAAVNKLADEIEAGLQQS
jgi:hypothetical protein